MKIVWKFLNVESYVHSRLLIQNIYNHVLPLRMKNNWHLPLLVPSLNIKFNRLLKSVDMILWISWRVENSNHIIYVIIYSKILICLGFLWPLYVYLFKTLFYCCKSSYIYSFKNICIASTVINKSMWKINEFSNPIASRPHIEI